MRISESVHQLCNEIHLLYGFSSSLDETHRQEWIKKALKQLAGKAEPLAHECKVEAVNLITQKNLRNYEIIRLDQLKEDEHALKAN